jgi:hypothetical protein
VLEIGLAKRKAEGMQLGRPVGGRQESQAGQARRQDRWLPGQRHQQSGHRQAAGRFTEHALRVVEGQAAGLDTGSVICWVSNVSSVAYYRFIFVELHPCIHTPRLFINRKLKSSFPEKLP